uniref:Uncharacterized protein n=1 Tax=Ascaris lumbricoides TaxID=6252 RepID=A0A0M3IIF3_ASCLU
MPRHESNCKPSTRCVLLSVQFVDFICNIFSPCLLICFKNL